MSIPDSTSKQALQILRDALDVASGEERDVFVRGRCGADAALLTRVASLLRGVGEADGGAPEEPVAADPLLGTLLGPFRVDERVGRGGMGIVYRGLREGEDFAQEVALKVIHRGFDFDDVHARFLRERRILARLDHPHLAHFIDGGVVPDGRPWFALEFVRGEALTRWCDERGLDIRARVRVFLDVCAAVQYAHTQLVVHRDLKPANILVDGDGRVKLLDFGIAKLVGNDDRAGEFPTTIGPRLRKFVARNRIAVGFAALAALTILAGMAATLRQTREARIQRDDALAAAKRSDAMRGYLMLMFRDATGQKDATKVNVREAFKSGAARLFDEFKDDPLAGQTAALMLSDLFIQLGDIEGGTPLLERLLQWPGIEANPGVQANACYNLAQIEVVRGNTARARELIGQAQAWWVGQPGTARAILNESRSTQARIERAEGKVDVAITTLHDAITERRELLQKDDFMVGNQFNTLSNALTQAGRYEEAAASADESHRVFERLGQPDSDGGMAALNSRGNAALMMGRPERALPDYLRVAEMTRALYGGTSKLAASLNNVGVALTRLDRHDEALPNLEEALRLAISQNGERSPLSVTARVSLAELYARVGRAADAFSLAESAVEIAQADYATNHILLATTYRARAQAHLAGERQAEARTDLQQATALFAATGKSGQAYIRLMAPLHHALEAK